MKYLFLFLVVACEVKPYEPSPCEKASKYWSELDGDVLRCRTSECVKWFTSKAENESEACSTWLKAGHP